MSRFALIFTVVSVVAVVSIALALMPASAWSALWNFLNQQAVGVLVTLGLAGAGGCAHLYFRGRDRVARRADATAAAAVEAARTTREEDRRAQLREEAVRSAAQERANALARYRQDRIKKWSSDPFGGASDKLFTRLSLLLPLGPDATDPWKKQDEPYEDLDEVLRKHPEYFAIVLLGDPGAGKSTLLQRLDIDAGRAGRISYYVSLRYYDGPDPETWLRQRWESERTNLPALPDFDPMLAAPGTLLLLDALNENQAARTAGHVEFMQGWQNFIHQQNTAHPQCRIIFSCRTLDYSGLLNTEAIPVPHLYIEKLDEKKMRFFCEHYLERDGVQGAKALADSLVDKITKAGQENLYGTAYFLRMLTRIAARGREVPEDSAALFTAFVRELLIREREKNQLLLKPGPLSEADLNRPALALRNDAWETPYELPEGGPLFVQLAELAYQMQAIGGATEGSQLTVGREWVVQHLAGAIGDAEAAAKVFKAAEDLRIIEEIDKRDQEGVRRSVQFVHQLMQEYFAGRRLARLPAPERAASLWKEGEAPAISVTLPDAEPLPPLSTPWDESMLFGAAMSADKGKYIEGLLPHNLPLAARAAARNSKHLSTELLSTVRDALVKRMLDNSAALRARIDAGKALGDVGDPGFVRKSGLLLAKNPAGLQDYLEPPMIAVPGGDYVIGTDRATPPWKDRNKSPKCQVTVPPFEIGRFPVTNAEWSCFMEAKGYDEESFWRSEAAKQWRSGKITYACWSYMWRVFRAWLREDKDIAERLWDRREISIDERDNWIRQRGATEDSFNKYLADQKDARSDRLTKPAGFALAAFSNPLQPVSGIGWFEAQAYCAWLTAQTGDVWRLPTEAEWEIAARLTGAPDAIYPWGDDFDVSRCNTSVARIRCTTPVGIFPRGDTAAGLSDICGNVFEWTSSAYEDYPYDQADGREADESEHDPAKFQLRVLRGGSWYYGAGYAELSFRLRYHPGFRPRTAGCRILRERRAHAAEGS